MQLTEALRRRLGLLGRQDLPDDDHSLSGPTLVEQEPDLAKEAGQHTLNASGWAAGGQPVD